MSKLERARICSSLSFLIVIAACPGLGNAADPAAIAAVQSVEDDFYSSHGQSVPTELDLGGVMSSPQFNAQVALIDQDQGVNNRATIDQAGFSNVAAVFQGFGNNNVANVVQNGSANYVAVTQSSDSNHIDQLSQQGNYNSATVNQYNGSNSLTLTQTYDYNRATVDQYGGTSLTVTQSNPGGSAASVNELTLKAYAEPGASSTFAPVTLSGAGQTQIYLCNGSSAYCGQVLPTK